MDILNYSVPFMFLLVGLESYYSSRKGLKLYDLKDTWSSIVLGLGSVFLGAVNLSIWFLIFAWVYKFHIFEIKPTLTNMVILFVVYDFALYIGHYCAHTIRIVWASHLVHHSSQKMNFTTAARQPWTESVSAIPVAFVPLLGYSIEMIAVVHSLSLLYQFCIHTTVIKRLPKWYELIFNSPAHHRVHHGNEVKYLDKNFGEVFIIWDRLFGTFRDEDELITSYGLVKQVETHNPITLNVFEFKNIGKDIRYNTKSVRDFFMFVFGPPGWSKDGSSKTTKQLRKEHNLE